MKPGLVRIPILLTLSCAIIVSLAYILKTRNNENEIRKETNTYQYFSYDPSTNESSYGHVRIYENIDPDEFIFDENEAGTGGLILISNFGSKEYVCRGSCFCNDKRRRSSLSISRGSIIYLLTAISTISALELAKEYFESECQSFASSSDDNICHHQEVVSVVEECIELPIDDISSDADIKGKSSSGVRKYFCEGKCLPKRFSRHEMRETALFYRCEEYELQEYVTLDITNSVNPNDSAKKFFQRHNMVPFCKEVSRKSYSYDVPGVKAKKRKRYVNLCAGSYSFGHNPTIRCRISSYL